MQQNVIAMLPYLQGQEAVAAADSNVWHVPSALPKIHSNFGHLKNFLRRWSSTTHFFRTQNQSITFGTSQLAEI